MEDSNNNPWAFKKSKDFMYFCCPECHDRFKTEDTFLEHAFENHPMAKDHMDSLKSENPETIKNKVENPEIVTQEDENLDIENPEPVNPGPSRLITKSVKCDNCNMLFESKPKLKSHTRRGRCRKNKLIGGKNHKCNPCGKTFPSKDDLENHTDLAHPKERIDQKNERKCDPCDRCFYTQRDFNYHQLYVHGERIEEGGGDDF